MASIFGWLDTSEGERRRVLDVIDLFKEQTTLDELGIGSVRDTIADLISPGTSTIQTRARYFFFVPWMYLDLERSKADPARFAQRARQREVNLIAPLSNVQESAGIIGIQAGAALKRLPSMIYWAGLWRLGFRTFEGSQDLYHRIWKRRLRAAQRDEAGDLALGAAAGGNWNPHLPAQPDGFPNEVTFDLTEEESRFFIEQLRLRAPGSLFNVILEQNSELPDIALPWEHPDLAVFPASLRRWLADARCYAELIHGAQLLYNLLLAEARPLPASESDFSDRIADWAENLGDDIVRLRNWKRGEFWVRLRELNPRLGRGVETFSEQWFSRVLSLPTLEAVRDDNACRTIVTERERRLKGPRARLSSRAHLETWGGDSGSAMLNYRWFITHNMATDILRGLAN